MKKWLKSTIVLVTVLVVVVGGTIGYRAYKSNKELKDKYNVTPALVRVGVNDIGLYISASGNITASEEVKVVTGAYGEVDAVLASEGQKVKVGDMLAVIDSEMLKEDVKTLEDEIFAKKIEIETSAFGDVKYYVKSPIDGEVKDIKVEADDRDTDDADEASDIAEVLAEYGYLCLISPDDLMYVITDETADFLKVGAQVKVSRYDYEYDGVVEKQENGKTYILVENDNITMGGRVNIYSEESNKKIKGTAELYEWVEITAPVPEGRIYSVSVYNNEYVQKGDVLFTYKARSQEMINLYDELEDLKEQLEEKQAMLENLEITAPVDGIVTSVALVEDADVEKDIIAFTLADTSVWVVSVAIDELDINQMELGMKAEVTIDASEGETFRGTVKNISSVGIASNGVTSYDVQIEVAGSDLFKMNMTANTEIEVQFISGALTVPVEAVREINGKNFVVLYAAPTDEEVAAMKKEMIEAEKKAQDFTGAAKELTKEDIQALREKKLADKGGEYATGDGSGFGQRQKAEGLDAEAIGGFMGKPFDSR